jgi:hypothetical protein
MTKGKRRKTQVRLGKQPPRYNFFLNPYEDTRFTSCPRCSRNTGQRKVPLLIHVDPLNPVALNYTCRYCSHCDLLIAHQDEIEAYLTRLFTQVKPEVIGNDYLVIGTLDRADWKRGLQKPLAYAEIEDVLHDFNNVWHFEVIGGWVRDK